MSPFYKVNPLDSAFRYMWIGFSGLFVSAIGLGFVVHDASKPVINQLAELESKSPEVVRGLLSQALMQPLPIVTGLMVLFFLIQFVFSGSLFLLRSIALFAKNDE